MKKRMFALAAASAFAVTALAAPAAAFEPPADPQDKFDGVIGFPGSAGQTVVMDNGGLGAWNAHLRNPGNPIEN